MARFRTLIGCAVLSCLAVALAAGPSAAQSASQTPGITNAAAWRALEQRRYAEALNLFEAAVRQAPRDASLRFGAGVANLMTGKNAEARRWFDATLDLDPGMTDAAVLLGQALYREGLLTEAIRTYETALRLDDANTDLIDPLERWRREADTQQQFSRTDGAHFTVLSEGSADQTAAERVLNVLEEAYWRIGDELSVYPQRPITVVIYGADQFREVTRLPEWATGVYDGRIKVPMGDASTSTADLRRVLEHELVHAMVAQVAGPTVPAWLNEGLATALEPGGLAWAESLLGTTATRVPFEQLARGFRGLSLGEAKPAYAQSAIAVKSLLDRHGAAGVMGLLRAIGAGVPFAEAFHQALSASFEEFASSVAH